MINKKSGKAIAIHQPNYLPWLGYFYKIYQVDIFVFLDDAQFSNQGMHNYTYMKTGKGSLRLKIPVKQSLGDLINEVQSKDELGWKERHLHIIEEQYSSAPHFVQVFLDYKNLLLKDYSSISLMNIELIKLFVERLGFRVDFVSASDLNIDLSKEEKIIQICRKLGGNIYYSGTGAKTYQNPDNFESSGIELKYSSFKQIQYNQLWGDFQMDVAALDYFMNCGYDWERVLNSTEKI